MDASSAPHNLNKLRALHTCPTMQSPIGNVPPQSVALKMCVFSPLSIGPLVDAQCRSENVGSEPQIYSVRMILVSTRGD